MLGLVPGTAMARDAVVRSFDDEPIITHFFPAVGLGSGERAPTVLVGHGFGQSGDDDPDSESEDLFGSPGLGPLREAGYNVLTWDARGFGESGGTARIDFFEVEGRDVQALIDFVAQQPEARLDGTGDPRLGMAGVSYGAGIQFVTAGIDSRVDAIVPTISWNSLLPSLYKDQVPKTGWGSALVGAGAPPALVEGLFGRAGPEFGNLDPQVYAAFTEGAATGKFSQASVDFFAQRGPPPVVDKVRAPTLLIQGTVDTLFTPAEAVRNLRVLQGNGVPARMMWFCGGHGACLTGTGSEGYLTDATLRWFDRYLQNDSSVDVGPNYEWLAEDEKWRSSETYPPASAGTISGSGSGTLPIAPQAGQGALILATPVAGDAVNVDVKAPAGANIVGEPKLTLTYRGTAAPEQTKLFAQLVDTERNIVVGNQARPIPVTLDGQERTIERPLEPIATRSGPGGSTYRLQIIDSTTLYDRQRSGGSVELTDIDIELPLRTEAADTRAPVAAITAPRVSSNASPNGTVPLSWSATDVGGGVASYDVQVRRTNRAVDPRFSSRRWTILPAMRGTTRTSTDFRGHSGNSYEFRVRARDRAGNVGGWTVSETMVVPNVETTIGSTYSGPWRRVRSSGALYGREQRCASSRCTVRLRYRGGTFHLVGRTMRSGGKARVTVGGTTRTVDFASSSPLARQVLLTHRASHKKRTVTIEVLGGGTVAIDGFALTDRSPVR